MSGIYITPLERIRKLQAENARLRALVGEPVAIESVEGEELVEQSTSSTLIEKTSDIEQAISLIAEILL